MTQRVANPFKAAPEPIKAMMALEASFANSGLDHNLLELVKLRSSQINGCAYCIHMHVTDLRRHGESDMRLHLLSAWRESSFFSPRERAALGWTEALTRVADDGASDEAYDALAAQFSEEERVQLTFAIGAINVWNRLQVGFRVAHPPLGRAMHADAA